MSVSSQSLWDDAYPELCRRARHYFRCVPFSDQEDCRAEAIALTWQSYYQNAPKTHKQLMSAFFWALKTVRFGGGLCKPHSDNDPLSWRCKSKHGADTISLADNFVGHDARRRTPLDSLPYTEATKVYALDCLQRPIPTLLLEAMKA